MPNAIRLVLGDLILDAQLNETATAGHIYRALPIEAEVSRWGDEIYFAIPVDADDADPMRAEMAVGELAFWPPGRAFCLFWGPTPTSGGSEPVAPSLVVPVGMVTNDLAGLQDVTDGRNIRIERRD